MPPKGVITRSEREIAQLAGVSQPLVNRKRRQGKSDEQIIAEAQARSGGRVEAEPSGEREESYAEAQARKETALADLRELELAQKRGELISAADVTTAWAAHISAAKSKLLSMGDELADKLAAESNPIRCRELVLAKVRTALAELADE